MENLLRQIINDIGSFRNEFNDLRHDVNEKLEAHGKRLGGLEATVTGIRDEHGKRLENLEKTVAETLNEHGKRLENLEKTVAGIRKEHGERLGRLETIVTVTLKEHGKRLGDLEVMVSGMRDEHGRMLSAIIESKDAQRGEINSLQYKSALMEGTLKRAANVIIEDFANAK